MRKIRTAVIGLVALSYYSPALGACDRIPSDLSSFGAVELGDTRTKLPRDVTRSSNCVVNEARNFADCEFTDKAGVSYIVFGSEVTRKEITVGATTRAAALPFGLSAGDTIGQVVRKILSRRDAPELYISRREGKTVVFSGFCVINRLRRDFAISFEFRDDDRLQNFAAYIEAN